MIELRIERDDNDNHLISVRRWTHDWSRPEPYWMPGAKRLFRPGAITVDDVVAAISGAEPEPEPEGDEPYAQ